MAELINKNKKYIKIGILILVLILSIVYLNIFFQKGISYDGTFLVKKKASQGIYFEGKSKWGKLEFILKGDYKKDSKVVLDYKLPNDIDGTFSLEFKFDETRNRYIVNILDDKDSEFFNGFYESNEYFHLVDEEENIIFQDPTVGYEGYESEDPYKGSYKLSPYNIVGLATQNNLVMRGDFPSFFMAIVILIITFIDIKKPLFFFNLDTFIYVKDAEPSDFYFKMQKISWIVLPLISVIILLMAIK